MARTEATEVRRELDRIRDMNPDRHTPGTSDAIEDVARAVVEQGTFSPDATLHSTLDLTVAERITGTRKQDITAPFLVGMVLGAALERDIPSDSTAECRWQNGEFTLP